MIVTAEVTRQERVIVTVDAEKLIAAYPTERSEFEGDDLAFVKQSLNIIGIRDLLDSIGENVDDGITVEGDGEDEYISILSVADGPRV